MSQRRPIDTAPKDGRKVHVFWTNADGEESESVARYHDLDRLRRAGGDWDEADAGWWTFTDSRTQQRIEPAAWVADGEENDE
ncbi:hypothetical protein SAZ10_10280 [Mesorhizobium sp. BAC0120]|uniref:hypothetical protein n=1 Tax=Mesorhizobium sp. BAC0120 TaxID=3090670 RepID=UPI00298D4091|nr:hypothetical protein [Mesorhizobium sp. BAC0120]MDW6022149.1 hypothetical protein [Mesorhizobium sp. BAC0120]